MASIREALLNQPGYFKVDDIAGSPQVLTAIGIETVTFDNAKGEETKDVLVFEETRKKLVLNATRLGQLAEVAADVDKDLSEAPVKVKLVIERIRIRSGSQEMICIVAP